MSDPYGNSPPRTPDDTDDVWADDVSHDGLEDEDERRNGYVSGSDNGAGGGKTAATSRVGGVKKGENDEDDTDDVQSSKLLAALTKGRGSHGSPRPVLPRPDPRAPPPQPAGGPTAEALGEISAEFEASSGSGSKKTLVAPRRGAILGAPPASDAEGSVGVETFRRNLSGAAGGAGTRTGAEIVAEGTTGGGGDGGPSSSRAVPPAATSTPSPFQLRMTPTPPPPASPAPQAASAGTPGGGLALVGQRPSPPGMDPLRPHARGSDGGANVGATPRSGRSAGGGATTSVPAAMNGGVAGGGGGSTQPLSQVVISSTPRGAPESP